jgi:3-isopropylmalate dehydrogenase
MILSLALLLRHSLKLETEASAIDTAVNETLNEAIFTADLSNKNVVDTVTMGSAIASNIT